MSGVIFRATVCAALFASFFLVQAQERPAGALSDSDLARIEFEQRLGAQVSGDLEFTDESGRATRLAEYYGNKPIIVVPGYYGCPMLCTMVLNGLVEAMQDMKWRPGKDFEILSVSINPDETPALAAAKKRSYIKRYGREGAAEGWHFLTGKTPAIRALTETIGFDYRFDPASGQYAHPSGVVILTPKGKVTHYLLGVQFSSRDLYSSLKAAAAGEVGSPVQKLLLLCFHYNPVTGRYSPTILGMLRMMSAATVLGVCALIGNSLRKPRAP